MPDLNEQDRADFEDFWRLAGTPEWVLTKDSKGEYSHLVVESDWSIWQAATEAARRQHGSAAQAVADPFDKCLDSCVESNPSPNGGRVYTLKIGFETLDDVLAAQRSLRDRRFAGDGTERTKVEVAALSRRPAAAAEQTNPTAQEIRVVAAEQPAAEPELSKEWLNAAAVADKDGAPEQAPETTEQMHARAKRALRVLSVARRTSTSGRADRAALGAIADNLAAVLYEVEAIEQHLRAAGQGKDSKRLDAERYRWMRRRDNCAAADLVSQLWDEKLDEAIDAAMKAGAQGGGK